MTDREFGRGVCWDDLRSVCWDAFPSTFFSGLGDARLVPWDDLPCDVFLI